MTSISVEALAVPDAALGGLVFMGVLVIVWGILQAVAFIAHWLDS